MSSDHQKILVATTESAPNVIYHANTKTWSGIFVVALNAVCERLNYSCEYVKVPKLGLEEEVLDGPMGAVTNGTADVGLVSSAITAERFQQFYFVHSLTTRTYSVVVHQDHLITDNSSGHTVLSMGHLFAFNVWVALLVIFLCAVSVAAVLDFFHTIRLGRSLSFPSLLVSAFFRIIGVSLGMNGTEEADETMNVKWPISKTVFTVSWLLYTTIILCTVGERLFVLFSFVTPQKLPFTDAKSLAASDFQLYTSANAVADLLQDIALQSKYFSSGKDFGINLGHITTIIYNKSSSTISKANKKLLFAKLRMISTNYSNDNNFIYHQQLVKQSRSALIVSENTLLKMSQVNCEMFVAIDAIAVAPISCLLMAQNSSFKEQFMRGYARILDEGIMQAGVDALAEYFRNASRPRPHLSYSCYRRKVSSTPVIIKAQKAVLQLDNFVLLYYGLYCASGLSLVVFVFELIVRNVRQQLRQITGAVMFIKTHLPLA